MRLARIPSVARVQIDVVDGRFAAPASWPYCAPGELERMIAQGSMLPGNLEYEMDLMCFDAAGAAAAWLTLGAARLTFHAESATDLPRFLSSLRRRHGEFIPLGLALGVGSDLALLEPCIGAIEYVQFMGIAKVGRQGEPFDARALEKVRVFRARHPEVPVQVDGGVSLERARALVSLGVSNVVVGSGILKAKDPAAALAAFEDVVSSYGG